MNNDYQLAGKLSDFAEPDSLNPTAVAGVAICNIDGELCAFTDSCTHEAVSFTRGYGVVWDRSVVCMLHHAVFDPHTGAGTIGPAYEPLGVFEVRVEGDEVFVSKAPRQLEQK